MNLGFLVLHMAALVSSPVTENDPQRTALIVLDATAQNAALAPAVSNPPVAPPGYRYVGIVQIGNDLFYEYQNAQGASIYIPVT